VVDLIKRLGNVVHDIDSKNDEKLQRAIHVSKEEEQYVSIVREQGGWYEHGSGSSQQQTNGFFDRLKRTTSRKGKSEHVQTRIDTGTWIAKSKQAKSAIGKACAKFFHTEANPGVKADNPYFIMACKETQRWGKLVSNRYLCV
jgi:hypothetical protein